MIKVNFSTYANYVTDSLYQWDLNRILNIHGLNLTTAPEVHFSNANMRRAIVRQATLSNYVVSVKIPNSVLQDPLPIKAHVGIYEGDEFKVIEVVTIPVIPKKRPYDYQIEDSDEEIYSFKALENMLAQVDEKWRDLNQQYITENVDAWLTAHPEATTTVQDHSLTIDKMVVGALGYVTPEMFGAVGDGVTDDTDAIQSAVDGGKRVIFSNKYLVSKPLNVKKDIVIDGGGTLIASKDFNGDYMLNVTLDTVVDSHSTVFSKITNVTFKCNNVCNGVYINNARKGVFENLKFLDILTYGLYEINGYENVFSNVWVNGTIGNNTIALSIESDELVNSVFAVNCKYTLEIRGGNNYVNFIHGWTADLYSEATYSEWVKGSALILYNAGYSGSVNHLGLVYSDTYHYAIKYATYGELTIDNLMFINAPGVTGYFVYADSAYLEHVYRCKIRKVILGNSVEGCVNGKVIPESYYNYHGLSEYAITPNDKVALTQNVIYKSGRMCEIHVSGSTSENISAYGEIASIPTECLPLVNSYALLYSQNGNFYINENGKLCASKYIEAGTAFYISIPCYMTRSYDLIS